MIIHAEGKLKRAFIYTDVDNEAKREEPAMVLYRPSVRGKCAIIPLSSAYKYAEPKSRQELSDVFAAVRNIAEALDYPLNSQSFGRIANTIQDGLDELIKMPPKPQGKKQHVGDATLTAGGERFTSPVMV